MLVSVFLSISCGDEGPTGPNTSSAEILPVRGNGQASEPGASLLLPFQVRVQNRGNGAPVAGATVRWRVITGAGASLEHALTQTDSVGMAESLLTLGPSPGTYLVQASVKGMEAPPAVFSADALPAPTMSDLSLGPASAGDTITIRGANFSTVPEQNVVTFSRVRGTVVSASQDALDVEVPRCLSPRQYEVRVRIGALSTGAVGLEVTGSPEALILAPGEDLLLDASHGLGCIHLPTNPGSYYLVVPHSTSTIGGAEHDLSLVWLAEDGLSPGPVLRQAPQGLPGDHLDSPAPAPGPMPVSTASLDAQDRWDELLRISEKGLLREGGPVPGIAGKGLPAGTAPAPVPSVGETRAFKVLNREGKFDQVTAELRYVSDHSLLYLDLDAPAEALSGDELVTLAQEFEDPIRPTLTETFGAESDLDQNGRVIILFSPAVNRLTDPDAEGFIGGFFYGLDLLPGRKGSNEGEIFYAMVPDPLGQVGPAIDRYTALTRIPAILAHEFMHMIHFNQRVLLGGSETTEALWLAESLAQMAEDLVGSAFEDANKTGKAFEYRAGNWMRARLFLRRPSQVTLLTSLPPGSLEERGAGWTFLKYVYGRLGRDDFLGQMVSSSLSGVANLTEAAGLPWQELMADWVGALYLDGTSFPVRPELRFQGVNLRTALSQIGGDFPLRPPIVGPQSGFNQGTLWSSAPKYFIINPTGGGGVAVSAGGKEGGPPEPELGLRVLVVRLL